jgi:ATP-binding cassette subfamily C protein CydD
VQDAAYRARADEFIRRLPDGYHSRVGEQGWGLSGGELQRIALARLFLRNSPLILLDEPGSHLDPDTEALLFDGIEELSRGKTLIVVAHRPTAVRLVERIAVMIDGRIAESGDHRMLRAANGEYARMMESFGVAL